MQINAKSSYDVFVVPLLRDGDVIAASVVFYFAVQFATLALMPRLSTAFRKLKSEDKKHFAVRVTSSVNGLIMFHTAYVFLLELQRNGWQLHNRHYTPIPEYAFLRKVIVGYFTWDVIVCIWYGWGVMWTVHGVVAALGTYLLSFPFSDQYGSYFTGMFETSNAFFHVASMLRMLNMHLTAARILEYIFAALFCLIRVMGGTVVTLHWYRDIVPLLLSGQVHSAPAIVAVLGVITVVMALQYIWFWEIVKAVLGLSGSKATSVDDVPHDTTNKERRAKSDGTTKSRGGGDATCSKRD